MSAIEARGSALYWWRGTRLESTVLVSVIDGSLHALDARSGRLLWAFSSGKPLVSASGPHAARAPPPGGQQLLEQHDDGNASTGRGSEGAHEEEDGDLDEEEEEGGLPQGGADRAQPRGAIIPGADGSLYQYFADGIRKLPVTAQQFVESSPSVTRDGVVVLGSKTSTVFLVDASTGSLLRRFDASDAAQPEERAQEEIYATLHALGREEEGASLGTDAQEGNPAVTEVPMEGETDLGGPEIETDALGGSATLGGKGTLEAALEGRPRASPLLIRRTDYTVRAVEVATGRERWNVTVGELSTLHHPLFQQHEDLLTAEAAFPQPGPWAAPRKPRGPPRPLERAAEGPLVVGHDNSLTLVDPASGAEAWQVAFPAAPVAVYTPTGVLVQELVSPPAGDSVIYLRSIGGQPFALPLSPAGGLPLAALPDAGAARSTKVTRVELPWRPAGGGSHGGALVPWRQQRESGGGLDQFSCALRLDEYACALPQQDVILSETARGPPYLARGGGSGGQLPAAPGPQSPPVPSSLTAAGALLAALLLVVVGVLSALACSKQARERRAQRKKDAGQTGPGRRRKVRRGAPGARNTMAEGGLRVPLSLTEQQDGALGASPSIGPDDRVSNGPDSVQRLRRDLWGEGGGGGRWVGRLFVSETVIGYGSHGTMVLEGELEGRRVAVKRMLGQFYDKARQEIAALIASDEHPNVVRCFAMEEDSAFVYVALERCDFSFADLVQGYSAHSGGVLPGCPELAERAAAVERVRGEGGPSRLWDEEDRPTEALLQICRDVIAGLAHLHELGFVHRDLKPQNVLICATRAAKPPGRRGGSAAALQLRAKLSDMGISKRLEADASSFDPHTGLGSSGWQAPEQMQRTRQTRSVDMFALGCLLFYAFSGGQHPFGDRYERDANVLRGNVDLFPIEHLPEAVHAIRCLLSVKPSDRLTSAAVQLHPVLWDAETRLAFLKDASDRVEGEDRMEESTLLAAVEAAGPSALGGPWDEKLDGALLGNLGQYRRYNFRSVRDLLRVIRNKCNHYRELPLDIQASLGAIPEGYEMYFRRRFPGLLLEMYIVLHGPCLYDPIFSRYFYRPAEPGSDSDY